jgi:hypothetical protein
MIGTNRYIGSPVLRIEDLRFLRGRGEFVADLRRVWRTASVCGEPNSATPIRTTS